MRCGGVADFVDTLHDGVEGSVVAYGGIGAVEVIVDGARQADDGEVEFVGKDARAGERAVAADDDQGVYLVALDHVVGELTSLGRLKLLAPGSLEDSAALLYDIRYVLSAKIHDFIGDESLVSAIDALDFQPTEYSGAGDRTDGGIHARGVAARREDAYTFNLCHGCNIECLF